MDDEFFADLLSAAMLGAPCATETCQLSAEPHRWYLEIVHLADGHTCPFHTGVAYPRYFLSVYTLLGSKRGALVAALNAWLQHLHATSAPATSSGGGGSAPIDGDPTADAALGNGSAGAGLGSPICWDAVGTGPSD
jgi:hypothetical protein